MLGGNSLYLGEHIDQGEHIGSPLLNQCLHLPVNVPLGERADQGEHIDLSLRNQYLHFPVKLPMGKRADQGEHIGSPLLCHVARSGLPEAILQSQSQGNHFERLG